jgi:two-component system, NarL family, nitrate/nitrite response regulator NarL
MARCESRSNRVSYSKESFGFSPTVTTRPHNVFAERRVSVVVVDDVPGGRAGEPMTLAGPPIDVVGQAPPGPEAVAMVERERPDVVVVKVDADHPVERATLDAMRAKHPVARVILVEHDHVDDLRRPGAGEGTVVTDDAFIHVVARIRQVTAQAAAGNGGRAAPTSATRAPGIPALTRREHEILRLVALGNTNNEIAQRLGLAANTVKTYWQRALHKLSARNRAEAIARAHEHHLI